MPAMHAAHSRPKHAGHPHRLRLPHSKVHFVEHTSVLLQWCLSNSQEW